MLWFHPFSHYLRSWWRDLFSSHLVYGISGLQSTILKSFYYTDVYLLCLKHEIVAHDSIKNKDSVVIQNIEWWNSMNIDSNCLRIHRILQICLWAIIHIFYKIHVSIKSTSRVSFICKIPKFLKFMEILLIYIHVQLVGYSYPSGA